MIDLPALASLRAVDTHGSVVAAADALGFTPSAVSQQVKRLERQTGVPLLERVGRGVMLTRQRPPPRRRGVPAADRPRAGRGRAAPPGRDRRRTPAGDGVRHRHARPGGTRPARPAGRRIPDLTLTLTEREPWDTVDLVASGQSDLGVVHSWGDVPLAIPEHLATTSLARDVADVIVHADHRLAGRSRVSPRDLVDEDWIATPDGTICREWLTRMYDGTGRLPRIAHQSKEFGSHLALVQAGLGIALVPRLGRQPLDGRAGRPAARTTRCRPARSSPSTGAA